MDVTNGGEHVSWEWGAGRGAGVRVGHPKGPGRASKWPQDPQAWDFPASLSFTCAFVQHRVVLSTFFATSQDEHLTCIDSLNLESQPGRQEGLSFCSITRAGRWEGICQSLGGKQVMPGVQPGLWVPMLSQPGSVSQVLLSTDRGAAR